MNLKREMIRNIQRRIDNCVKDITNMMKEYGYFYDLTPEDAKSLYKNYTEIYKTFPERTEDLLATVLGGGIKVKKLEKLFTHYRKICSQFKYPDDRVMDPKVE